MMVPNNTSKNLETIDQDQKKLSLQQKQLQQL